MTSQTATPPEMNLTVQNDPPILALTVEYDNDLASIYHGESFKEIEPSVGHWRNAVYEYTDHGNIPDTVLDAEALYDFSNISDDTFFRVLYDEHKHNYPSTFDGIREFIQELGLDHQPAKDAFIEHIDATVDCSDLYDDDCDIIHNTGATKKFLTLETRGYSQGDWAKVFINIPSYEKVTGKPFDDVAETHLKKNIDHLFWDSPVYARLEIGVDELHLEQYLSNPYQWDKEEVLRNIKDQPDHIMEYLINELPEEPSYP
jgi:hypothetical protein